MVAGAIRVRGPIVDEPIRLEMLKVREEHARNQKHDYSHVFKRKTKFDFIRMSCIIIGIEFAYAAETAFVSPTLLEIGIQHKHMTMVWSLSPILGFFLAPLMGSISDRCRLKWGRRRPLILFLSIFLVTGLLLVSWGKNLGVLLGDRPKIPLTHKVLDPVGNSTSLNDLADSGTGEGLYFYKWAALMTVLGTILLDFSADTCQTPARTYLLDICTSEDHARGLSIFTVMAGMGGFMGYSLGGINWELTTFGEFMGGNVKTVFTIVTVLFVIACITTLTSFREIPLPLMERDELLKPISQSAVKREQQKNNNPVYVIKEVSEQTPFMELTEPVKKPVTHTESEKHAAIEAGNNVDEDDMEEPISLGEYLKSIVVMPTSMKILCCTNLLSWMAHVSYCLYFTDFVGETVFLGDPMAPAGSEKLELYQSGVRFGCWGMAIYALSCAVYSMAIERLIRMFGAKCLYIGGLVVYGAGMLALAIYPTKIGVLLLSITAGIIYATIFTIPYLLIANYHANGSFKKKAGENVPSSQTRGLGTDIAVIGSMMFVAQIIVSLNIGPLITVIGSTSAVIYAASVLSLCAAGAATRVLYLDL